MSLWLIELNATQTNALFFSFLKAASPLSFVTLENSTSIYALPEKQVLLVLSCDPHASLLCVIKL